MSDFFRNPLNELAEYQSFSEVLLSGSGMTGMTGLLDSEKVHFMSTFLGKRKYQLIVTYSEQRTREIADDYRLFSPDVRVLVPKDLIFFSADLQNNAIVRQRMQALEPLIEGRPAVIVTTIDSLMNAMPPLSALQNAVLAVREGEEIDLTRLAGQLIRLGYERSGRVEEPGTFSIRGDIADLWPLTDENPTRIELFGDEVDSIRLFDADSQRSIERREELVITPASEMPLTENARAEAFRRISDDLARQTEKFRQSHEGPKAQHLRDAAAVVLDELQNGRVLSSPEGYVQYFYPGKTQSVLDYFPADDTLIFLDEPMRLKERGDGVRAEFEESVKGRLASGDILPGQADLLQTADAVLERMSRPGTAAMSGLEGRIGKLRPEQTFSLQVQNVNSYRQNFEGLLQDLQRWKKEKYRVVFLCPSHTRARRLVEEFQRDGLNAFYSEEKDREVLPGEILVSYGNLHRGFVYPMIRFAVITDSDLTGGQKARKREKRQPAGTRITDYHELHAGDYVVHDSCGIGIYRGMFRREMDHVTRDFLKIEYGDGGSLYIPVTQLDHLSKYADADAKAPKLNTLGGPEWKKTRARVKKAVTGIARELVQLYAQRSRMQGHRFPADTPWQREFEEDFPYEETEDQEKAIRDVKQDMESTKIMDRLICGDVGYGKTEVAIRAAFKAVQDSRQVAYLAPTTILVQQIYTTFCERMKNYPVRIGMLSRFRTAAQNRQTVEALRSGQIDIVIGTHRLLSKDVQFKNLGLLIVDEEQRFGVTHKEKIKQLKKNVDVITMTATPIPRTLHMSLVGVRDMSVLEEPPSDRRPIQTYVMEMNWEMVREAINRELARQGQVYYVYNRVQDIAQVAEHVQSLVPDARVAFAHGKMPERQMEEVMMDFVNGDIDILVSTTIIETGIDIPNVNTIIIQDADRYGLSQLYQLRGRVGRSSRNAYAFILYQRGKVLTEVAEKRLQAIREYTDLGSGIRVAMRDLEIRGAGNMLGEEQSGQVADVGYDLYVKMLNEAVLEESGKKKPEESFDTSVDLPFDAFIPDQYVTSEDVRMELYQRIAQIGTEEEASDMMDELIDRFGDIPKPVENLLAEALLRRDAHEAFITEIRAKSGEARISLYPNAPFDARRIPALVEKYGGALKFVNQTQPYLTLRVGTGRVRDRSITIQLLKEVCGDIKLLKES